MKIKILSSVTLAVFLLCAFFSLGAAKAVKDDLPPIEQSAAYQDFLKKPVTNVSKGMCILNYFRDLPVSVQYEGVDYPVLVAYPLGVAYFLANYRNEDPRHWVKKNCYRSLQKNEIIYLKLQDGRFRPVRDIFLEKLDELDKLLQKAKVS